MSFCFKRSLENFTVENQISKTKNKATQTQDKKAGKN